MVANNYTLTNRCPNATTTDCVSYTGPAIPCLNICTGDQLSQVECAIATNLCLLVGNTNVSTVVIPTCLQTAWGTQNLTILNLFNFILEQACIQQTAITSLTNEIATIDPIITVNYPAGCPCTNQCNPGATLSVSTHIENILICLCNLYSLLGTLPTEYTSFAQAIIALGAQYSTICNYVSGMAGTINQIVGVLNANVITNGNFIQPLQQSPSC